VVHAVPLCQGNDVSGLMMPGWLTVMTIQAGMTTSLLTADKAASYIIDLSPVIMLLRTGVQAAAECPGQR
jgi:hypothetical protein